MGAVQAVEQALQAYAVAVGDPVRARRLAASALAAGGADPEVRSIVSRARGVACGTGDLPAALEHLTDAVAVAEDAGLTVRAAEARGSLAYHLVLAGDGDRALREIDRALPDLTGLAAARMRMQQALVLAEIGRFAAAASGYARALEDLRRAGGDALLEADLRNNRSLVAIQRRDWRAAEDDLARAEELYAVAGQDGRIGLVLHNRACVAAVRGDVPSALAFFDDAARRFADSGRDPGLLPVEEAEALLSVRLVAEARETASGAVASYVGTGNATDLAQARLVLAEAALLAGDLTVAQAEAELARRAYRRLGRPGWAALARHLALRAGWEGGERSESALRSGRRTVEALTAAGWTVQALDARLIVARTALHLGRLGVARRELRIAALARRRGPADLRARAWHAEALLRLSDGDPRGAESALRAGIGVLDRFRSSLGATELRAGASGHGAELAGLGLALAVAGGRPAAALAWGERWRAGALRRRPARPPDDAALADDLAALRQIAAEIADAAADGRPTAALLRSQAALEDAVRRRARHVPAVHDPDPAGIPTVSALAAALHSDEGGVGEVLVEYVLSDGFLHAVAVAGGRAHLHPVAAVEDVDRELTALRFGLRRLAHIAGSRPPSPGIVTATETAAARLDALLLDPVRHHLGFAALVVVPTGVLHAVPWAALPSCVARPVTVAPSAALWLRATGVLDAGDGPHVLVAGPGLPHAAAEVAALARRYPGAVRFTGRRAAAAAVVASLDGAALAHLAAHGHLRSDNPQFSSLQLADGPLTVHDLERVAQAPRLVVLSACDAGLPAVGAGDEVLGLAAALLGLGTRSLVAPVLPVPDEATRALMLALHRKLRRGLGPAAALAGARTELAGTATVAGWVAAAAFGCFGAGA